MTAKVYVTVDTATLSRPSVERLLRQHQLRYDIAGTEPAQGDDIEASDGQSPYCLSLPDRATDAETAFVREVLDTVRLVQHPHLRAERFFYAHVLADRAVFLTAHDALFGAPRRVERNRLAALAKTRIMSFAEFERWCNEPRLRTCHTYGDEEPGIDQATVYDGGARARQPGADLRRPVR